MNWTIAMVIGVIAVLVPTALLATFAATKDTHRYARHYGRNGFTPELPQDLTREDTAVSSTAAKPDCEEDPPVVDWPQEL